MDENQYEPQIGASKRRMAELQASMEAVQVLWLRSVAAALAAWYESAIRNAVKEQYELVQTLGSSKMLAVKERFVLLLQETASVVWERLSAPAFWLHKHGPDEAPDNLLKEGAYSLDRTGFLSLMQVEWAGLFGRLVPILLESGLSVSKEVAEALESKGNFRFIVSVCSSCGVKPLIDSYSSLQSEYVLEVVRLRKLRQKWIEEVSRQRELEEKQKIENAKRNALEIWETAFSQSYGQDINWDRAWRKAEGFWTKYSKWNDRYEAWLIGAGPEEGDDDFQSFLKNTGNVEKHEKEIRRVWRIGLMRSVQRQMGKQQWEQWMQLLVSEQLAKRSLYAEYSGYEAVLQHYRDHICPNCRQYARQGFCFTCDECNGCCSCDSGEPQDNGIPGPE